MVKTDNHGLEMACTKPRWPIRIEFQSLKSTGIPITAVWRQSVDKLRVEVVLEQTQGPIFLGTNPICSWCMTKLLWADSVRPPSSLSFFLLSSSSLPPPPAPPPAPLPLVSLVGQVMTRRYPLESNTVPDEIPKHASVRK